MRRVMLPTASWIVFAADVMSGYHVLYNAPRYYPMSLLLSVVFGLLGLSACGFSIETAYDMVVVCIYIYNSKN